MMKRTTGFEIQLLATNYIVVQTANALAFALAHSSACLCNTDTDTNKC